MNPYKRKATWKIYLALGGLLIMLVAMGFTYYLVTELMKEERNRVELFKTAQQRVSLDPLSDRDVTMESEIIELNHTIPILIVDEDDNIDVSHNFNTEDPEDLARELEKMKASGEPPLIIEGPGYRNKLYYKNSRNLTWLTYFPVVMLSLLAGFIGLGYLGFSTSRRSEQNQVWVGMAKETAHQLGTPISAILAWIEHLKLEENNPEKLEIISELSNDVDRLDLIADRFSKIGSEPKLEQKDIFVALNETQKYMQRRAPRKVQFEFPSLNEKPLFVLINFHLFSWVLENLIRNALDAMEGTGLIKAVVTDEGEMVCIDISDSGKGVPPSKQKTVFQPGYTTKKRGWGLGLSLAKRIVENYHKGKIYISKSEPDVGTTFTIKLPKATG